MVEKYEVTLIPNYVTTSISPCLFSVELIALASRCRVLAIPLMISMKYRCRISFQPKAEKLERELKVRKVKQAMRWQEKIIGKVRVKKYSKSSLKVSCFIRLPSSLLHLIFQFRFSLLFQLPPPFIFQFPHFNWQEKVVLFILDLPQWY